jgi:hypothetical protein
MAWESGMDNAIYHNGFTVQADSMLTKLLGRAQGLGYDESLNFREYDNPLSGEGLGATHFGWTAAHVLLSVLGDFLAV